MYRIIVRLNDTASSGLSDKGKWTMENGKLTMENGQWTGVAPEPDIEDNGQWTMDEPLHQALKEPF